MLEINVVLERIAISGGCAEDYLHADHRNRCHPLRAEHRRVCSQLDSEFGGGP